MAIHERRVAASSMVYLRPIIKIITNLVGPEVRIVPPGPTRLPNQQGLRWNMNDRGPETALGNDEPVHMIRHQLPRFRLGGTA